LWLRSGLGLRSRSGLRLWLRSRLGLWGWTVLRLLRPRLRGGLRLRTILRLGLRGRTRCRSRLRLGLWLRRRFVLRLLRSRLRSWLRCRTSLGLLGTRLRCGTGFGLNRSSWLNLRAVVGFGWTDRRLDWLDLWTFIGLAGVRDFAGACAGLTGLNRRLAGPDEVAWAGGGLRWAGCWVGTGYPGLSGDGTRRRDHGGTALIYVV
jgi:hypothetical protein